MSKTAIERLREGNEVSLMVEGNSMNPTLVASRDIVNISPVNRPLKRGDIVIYFDKNLNKYLLHRIAKITPEHLIIRGDNNIVCEFRQKDEILGIMTSYFKNGRYKKYSGTLKNVIDTVYIIRLFRIRRMLDLIENKNGQVG